MKSQLREDKILNGITSVILIVITVIALYPLYYVLIASFSDPVSVALGETWLIPKGITLEGYKAILGEAKIWTGYGNTVFYTVIATILNVFFTMAAAFPLSFSDLPGKKYIMIYLAITMFFNGGLIPTYFLMKNLGFLDNRLVMIIPGLVTVWNITIARTNIQSNIPNELIEAARIDGCSLFGCFVRMILPLSKAIMAVLVLYYGVGHWNSYFSAMIYLTDEGKYPLQLVLREILIQTELTLELIQDNEAAKESMERVELMKYGIIVVSSVPVLILYPMLQKYFVKGVMVGSLKG